MINVTLDEIKSALGITGDYQDATLQIYFDEVIAFLVDAGVSESNITSGVVARGVADLWNYGSGDGKLSQYFVQRAIQLTKFNSSTSASSGGGGSSPDLSNYYNKMETDALLLLKANIEDVYTKNEADIALLEKQNKSEPTLETDNKQIPNAINEVNGIAKGAQKGISYGDYETMVNAFNALASTVYNIGQSVYVVTLEVPDLWISDIESGSVPYTYTTDEAFVTALQTDGYVQVGFYKLSALETGKVDLTNYYDKTETDNLLTNKLTEPSSGLAVGKYFRIASIDENGHAVLECVDAPTAPVQSISAAGTNLPPDANGNVNIPRAEKKVYEQEGYNYGVVRFGKNTGIGLISCFSDHNVLGCEIPTNSQIDSRDPFRPVVLNKLDYAVKAAMTDGIGAAWTDTERLAALLRMGCTVDENGFVKFTSQN